MLLASASGPAPSSATSRRRRCRSVTASRGPARPRRARPRTRPRSAGPRARSGRPGRSTPVSRGWSPGGTGGRHGTRPPRPHPRAGRTACCAGPACGPGRPAGSRSRCSSRPCRTARQTSGRGRAPRGSRCRSRASYLDSTRGSALILAGIGPDSQNLASPRSSPGTLPGQPPHRAANPTGFSVAVLVTQTGPPPGLALGREGDARGGLADLDGRAWPVGGCADRRHRPRAPVDDVGGLPVRGDRDPPGVVPDLDRRAWRVGGRDDRRDRVAVVVGDVGLPIAGLPRPSS